MGTPDQNGFKDIIKKVNMYLDNELAQEDQSQLINDINTNPEYHQILEDEKKFRKFIKSKINRQKPSPDFLKSLKEKIRRN